MDSPQSKKMLIMNILEILQKYSDEDHRLSQRYYGSVIHRIPHESRSKVCQA